MKSETQFSPVDYIYDEADINYGISYEEEAAPLSVQTPQFENSILNAYEAYYFKVAVVTLTIVIIAIGILLNLTFQLIIAARLRRQTTTTILLFSVATSYILILISYALRVSTYLEDDNNVLRFHMYDTLDHWQYGQLMCQTASGLPVFAKFLTRITLLIIALKRLLKYTFVNDCSCSDLNNTEDEQDMLRHETEDAKLNYGIPHNLSPSPRPQKGSTCCGKLKCIKRIFDWPFLLLLVIFLWFVSFGVTLPLFGSFKLTSGISQDVCNSVYKFPEELESVRSMYWNYLVYCLVLPSGLTFLCLLLLGIVQMRCCMSKFPGLDRSPSLTRRNKANTSNSSSSSSATSFTSADHLQSCSRSRGNNTLLWVMLIISLATSLPQELYRYVQLSKDLSNTAIMDTYLSNLANPLAQAKPYYSFQLLYISEALIMPAFFLLFTACSLRRSRPTRSESDADLTTTKCRPEESIIGSLIRSMFFDTELANSKKHASFLAIYKQSEKTETKVFLDGEHPFPQVTTNAPVGQCSNNVMHIIQHPSWRINIKQNGEIGSQH